MQLTNIITITADLELLTGLRIGGGDTEMHIGGVDNSIIKHPITQEPYLPGSSIKGKIRSLLEWRSGAVKAAPLGWKDYQQAGTTQQSHVLHILQLFGLGGADDLSDADAKKVGPSRLSFWDCSLNAEWAKAVTADNLPLTEVKSENRINRIAGTAEHPRQTERIPAGAKFDFRLSLKQITGDDEKLTDTLLAGLKLLELDSLGGSGSRGYGKIKFVNLKINGEDISAKFDQV
ncbi:MAG: type III-A CRISPR-associated RAMP protein Csm3, partial [Sulfuriferula sp.]